MRWQAMGRIALAGMLAMTMLAAGHSAAQAAGDVVLKPADMQKLLPAAVYFRGQSAPAQLRNSGGVKFADSYYVLATLVDTSGYASDLAAKYQAYFITEVPLKIGGQRLPAGVYGVGFIGGDKFVVDDIGGHDLLTIGSATDAAMKGPRPLLVTTNPAGGFRLYEGRRYVTFRR